MNICRKNIRNLQKLFIGIEIVIVTSCQYSPSALDQALTSSGKNRSELEKVLAHYSQKETDTLHLKAARFLIENMPRHYELCSSSLSTHKHLIDSLHSDMPYIAQSTILSILSRKESTFRQNYRKEDIENITADFLIEHIDTAISMWKTCLWLKIAYKEATVDSLTFESVPANTLYWLKDLTEGKEERIFTYENGQVRFW